MLTAQLFALTELVEEEHEVDKVLSFGIGAVSLAILLGLLIALVAIGGGREHS